nr:uncharacterized protein LOC129153778 [Nothobranchius furzeri]XP_054593273.1 uncharacterized protein LOC129160126 [Nothobranchius furzeri]
MGRVYPSIGSISQDALRAGRQKTFTTMADSEAGAVGEDSTYKWTKDKTQEFIQLRAEMDHMFTGAKHSASVAWRSILEKMSIQGKVTPIQAKKKWDNLKKKYKVCRCVWKNIT